MKQKNPFQVFSSFQISKFSLSFFFLSSHPNQGWSMVVSNQLPIWNRSSSVVKKNLTWSSIMFSLFILLNLKFIIETYYINTIYWRVKISCSDKVSAEDLFPFFFAKIQSRVMIVASAPKPIGALLAFCTWIFPLIYWDLLKACI